MADEAPTPAATELAITANNAIDKSRSADIQAALARAQAKLAGEAPAEPEAAPAAKAEPEAPPPPAKGKAKTEPEAEAEAAAEPDEPEDVENIRQALIYERRQNREKADRREAEWRAARDGEIARLRAEADRLAPYIKAAEAMDSGDFDELAVALAKGSKNDAITDWNTLIQEVLRASQTPAYREVRKIKADLAKREEADRAARDKQAEETRVAAQRQAQEQYMGQIARELEDDEDPAIADLVSVDRAVVQHVFGRQQAHYTQHGGEVLPSKKAAALTVKDLHGRYMAWHEFFTKHKDSAFVREATGVPKTAETQATSAPRVAEKKVAKAAPPSHKRTAEASAAGRMSDAELKALYRKKMERAAEEDRQRR